MSAIVIYILLGGRELGKAAMDTILIGGSLNTHIFIRSTPLPSVAQHTYRPYAGGEAQMPFRVVAM